MGWLLYVIPVLFSLLPSEKSEHIRLLQHELLHTLVQRFSAAQLRAHFSYMIPLMLAGLQDSAPDILVCSAHSARAMCDADVQLFRSCSQQVCTAAMPLLLHRHARVRCAGIELLQSALPCGAAELIRTLTAFREHNVIDIHGFYHGEQRHNYFALLVQDQNNKVRTFFFRMMAHLCTEMKERADYGKRTRMRIHIVAVAATWSAPIAVLPLLLLPIV